MVEVEPSRALQAGPGADSVNDSIEDDRHD